MLCLLYTQEAKRVSSLVQSLPSHAGMSQFRDRLAASAQSQAASPFFDRLPSEIRQQIYRDLWDLCDVRWHVHAFSARAVPVFQCLTHPDDDDTRYARFQAERGSDAAVWESRLRSPWNTHWRCAEAAAAELSRLERRRVPPDAHVRLRDVQLLAPLLVCRRMYEPTISHPSKPPCGRPAGRPRVAPVWERGSEKLADSVHPPTGTSRASRSSTTSSPSASRTSSSRATS